MSRLIRNLLAATAVALATAVLPTPIHADDDDWEDYYEDQQEAWEDYYKSQQRHGHYHGSGAYYGNGWYGSHGYGGTAYDYYQPRHYSQPGYYGYGGQSYGYGQPYYCPHHGYSGYGYYGRPRRGFHFRLD